MKMITADGCFDHPNYCMEFTPRTAGKEARRSDFNYCKLLTHYIKGKSFEEASPEIKHKNAQSNRKSFEKTGPPFEVDQFSRSDRLEFWLNGSRP